MGAETCHSCGDPLDLDDRFCRNCGAPNPSAPHRVSTGIMGTPSLDELLEGGFESGKTYLVAGGAGTGKTIFGLQFLLRGIVAGEPGIYVPLQEEPERLVQDVRRLGWNLEKGISENKLLILPFRHSFMDKNDPNETIKSIVEELEKKSKKISARRLVIDPIEALFTEPRRKEYICYMMSLIEDKIPTTNIITSQLSTSLISLDGCKSEEIPAAGIIVMGYSGVDNQLVRSLFIQKMAWVDCRIGIYRFEIMKNRGIVLREPLQVVKKVQVKAESNGNYQKATEDDIRLGLLKQCPNCGSMNNPKYKFCTKCGYDLFRHELPPPP